MEKLIQSLQQLSISNPQGFTVDLNLNFITTGFVIATIETQDSFGDEGLKKVIEVATQNNYCIGGWLNEVDSKFYWDATIVVADKAQAVKLGKRHKQLAIFDLDNQQLIWL